MTKTYVYFAGKLVCEGACKAVWNNGQAVFQDRLGTNRASGARFRPCGDEIGGQNATTNDRQKFATYNRDGFSGLDYADQRYFASTLGRFNTADPFQGSAKLSDPGSWNRYSCSLGDPVNQHDPSGLAAQGPVITVPIIVPPPPPGTGAGTGGGTNECQLFAPAGRGAAAFGDALIRGPLAREMRLQLRLLRRRKNGWRTFSCGKSARTVSTKLATGSSRKSTAHLRLSRVRTRWSS